MYRLNKLSTSPNFKRSSKNSRNNNYTSIYNNDNMYNNNKT